MLLKTPHGEREVRSGEWGTSEIPPYSPAFGGHSHAGALVSISNAIGLAAVGAAIRLVSHTGALMPIVVYSGRGNNKRRAEGAWQQGLLDDPCMECSPFDFYSDIFAGPETAGNAYVQKLKFRGRVVEMVPLNPQKVRPVRDRRTNKKLFDVWTGAKNETFTPADILHIRGFTYGSTDICGWSPIAVHRHALGSAIRQEEYAAKFYANNASPGGYISVPGQTDQDKAKRMVAEWMKDHAGATNAHKPGVLANGAEWKHLGVSMRDAQFIESQKYGV